MRPGDTVCDIGANKGSYLFWLSRWVKQGRVIAFEPQAVLAEYLTEVCCQMHLDNVTVEPKAVYSSTGRLMLHIPGGKVSPGASLSKRLAQRRACKEVTVPVVSLDDYFQENQSVTVLKIDVEGGEMDVFKGANRILKSQSPLVVFECENRHLESGSVFDVFAYLHELNYDGEFICRHELRPIKEFNPDLHQKRVGEGFGDARNYCNNFVFRKKA